MHRILARLERSWSYATRRFASLVLSVAFVAMLVYLFAVHTRYFSYVIGVYYFASVLSFFVLVLGGGNYVSFLYKTHDYIVAHFIFFVLLVLAVLQVGYCQTWLLYHNALSSGVVIEDILKYARKSKEQAQVTC